MSITVYFGSIAVITLALGLVIVKMLSRLKGKQREHWASLQLSTAIPQEETQAGETVFRQLAESIRVVFWMADCEQGRLIYVSPAMLDAWLLDPQSIINDASRWFAAVHRADRERAESAYAAMLQGDAKSSEYRVVRPDGEIRYVRNRNFHVPDPTGKSRRMAGILEDVTAERTALNALQESRDELVKHVNELKSENRERRRAEEQLRAAKNLAEAGSRVKSQFLCNISHELRTPLNGIIGMVQIALDANLSDEQRDCLKAAAESAENLLAIVNDILDFSHTEAGLLAITEAPFKLRGAVREVAKRIAMQACEKQLDFAWMVSSEVPDSVVGDKRRLMQVLTHLCANAVKFTASGSVALEVSRDDSPDRRRVRFSVSDTGIGVPQESRSAIFEAFTQADGSLTRSHGGTGIGLAVCSKLVALMSGEISMESEPGKGSRFAFTIPLGISRSGQHGPHQTVGAKPAVLIVDPNPTSLGFSTRALTEEGFDVTSCVEESEALVTLEKDQARFAAILLPADLGGGNGLELARLLSEKYKLRHRLYVQLSQANQTAQIARCRELGIRNYFGWPLDYDELRQRLLLVDPPVNILPAGPTGPKPGACGRKLRVLLVEDNPINQRVLRRMLQKQGHSVVTADHGLAALTKLDETDWNVDLALMDVQMPELDGFETTTRIRELEKNRGGHLPIIAATAHAMPGDAERCLSAGMDGYIAKPIQLEALSRIIGAVMCADREKRDLKRRVS